LEKRFSAFVHESPHFIHIGLEARIWRHKICKSKAEEVCERQCLTESWLSLAGFDAREATAVDLDAARSKPILKLRLGEASFQARGLGALAEYPADFFGPAQLILLHICILSCAVAEPPQGTLLL